MLYICQLILFGLSLQKFAQALPRAQDAGGDINFEQNAEAENAGNAPPIQLQQTGSSSIQVSPTSQVVTSTSSTQTPAVSGYGNNEASGDNKCVLFDPPDETTTIQMCKNICGEALAKQVAAGDTGSVSCISVTPIGSNPEVVEPGYHDEKMTPGNCTCNDPLIDMLANTYVSALPVIAEIGCELLVTAFQYVAEAGALAIPGAGEAIDGGMIAGITAAKLASYSYDAGSAGFGAFQSWAKPCGSGSQLPPNMQKVFNIMQSASPAVIPKGGFKVPPNLAKGGEMPKEAGPKNPAGAHPKDPAKEKPTKDLKPTKKATDEPKHTSQPSEQSCDKEKRANNKKKQGACTGVNHVTSLAIAKDKSKAMLKTGTVTCRAALYGQACFNYYSIMQNGKGQQADHLFTCSDSQKTYRGNELTATKEWKAKHNRGNNWKSYMTTGYVFVGAETRAATTEPKCAADEWPPSYFRDPINNGQLMRWLPGSENSGAGSLWKDWCKKNDGGQGNGQSKAGKLNEDLVKTLGKPLASYTKKNGAMTTTFETYSAEFTRAVFTMDFDWTGGPLQGQKPDNNNDWGLRVNPCWPEAIVPDDPGFVLKIDDPWYDNHRPQPDLRNVYSSALIPSALTQSANNWLLAHPNFVALGVKASSSSQRQSTSSRRSSSSKKKAQTSTVGQSKNSQKASGSKSNQKGSGSKNKASGKQAGSSNRKRYLEMVDNELVIIEFNATRTLTDEEIEQNVEVIQCADRTCSKERILYDEEDDILIIDGERPSMSPPANVESVPTGVAQTMPQVDKKTFARRFASPELPVVTASL